jgi:hypothetical protein
MSFVFQLVPEKKHVFLHIPKNGGTTLGEILGCYNPYAAEKTKRPSRSFVGHLTYQETKALFAPDEALSFFCVVRNPWARVVSNYNYIKQTSPGKHGVKGLFKKLKKGMSFEDFLDDIVHSGQQKFKPQMDYMVDENGVMVVDDVLRLEHYQEDLSAFLQKYGCEANIEAKKHNTSKHKHYTEYFQSEEAIRLVAEYEAGVIEMFGYTFGGEASEKKGLTA